MPQNGVPIDGAEVRRRREALFLTQEELADKAGIHQNTLVSIESPKTGPHRASFGTIKGLAKALGCARDAIIVKEQVA